MAVPQAQQQVADFLARLAGRPALETHISAIFAGPDVAYKLKKAVRLPFLDFTTVAARRHFLERELALDKPAAPEIYHDVMAVERDAAGALTLVPAAESHAPLDWVLRMASVPEGAFLEAIIARGGFDEALAAALGDCIARDHAARPLVAHWDSAAGLAEAADGCVASARAAGLPAEPVAAWHRDFRATLEQHAALLAARAACGHVRRCHGDLHEGNILLWHGAPLPFDALEFDEALATIDVGYDLAFLLMDIDYSVGRWAANRVFNRYIARTGDAGIAGPMAMFMSLRACVRAHVEAARGHPGPAQAYLSAAAAYLAPAPCVLVAVGGLPGTGKSTLARRLAPRIGAAPGAALLRSDEVRKQQAGVAPETKLPASSYAAAAKQATAALHLGQIRAALGGGHTVIADATFLAAADRHAIAAIAASLGVPFIGLWLRAPPDVLRARVRARAHDASDADAGVLEAALAQPTGDIAWHMIDATKGDDALAEAGAAIGALTPIKADRCTAA